MIYNFTNLTGNMTTATSTIIGFNNLFFCGLIGLVICIIVFAISFSSFITRTGNPSKSYLASSWIAALVAVGLRIVGLMNDYILIGIILTAAAALAVTWNK